MFRQNLKETSPRAGALGLVEMLPTDAPLRRCKGWRRLSANIDVVV